MYFRGDNLELRENNDDDLKFQVIDWFASDEVSEEEYIGKDKKTHTKRNRKYCIRLFGSTIEGHSVSANVYGYTPHFYIKVPDIYYKEQYRVKPVMDSLISKMNSKYKKIKTYKLMMMKDIWGFSNNKKCPFIKIIFTDLACMNACVKIIKDENLNGISFKDKLYESNIPPFLRFIHKNEIKPAGWVIIKKDTYEVNLDEDSKTTCQIDVDVNDWRKVHYLNSEKMAPFIIASIDGEMTSSHGDFPLAKKNYKKLAQEIYENYSKNEKKLRTESSDVLEQLMNEMLNKAFHSSESEYDISNIYTKDNEKPSTRLVNNISKKIADILIGKETYGILSLDIINILFSEIENIDTDVSEQSIYTLICDSFADDRTQIKNEEEITIVKMYTIGNKKPSKKTLYNIACRSYKVIKKLVYCLRKILKDDDICKLLSNDKTKISKSTLDESNRLIDMYNNQIIALYQNNLPELDDSKETIIMRMLDIMEGFPAVCGDEIIQLGTSIQRYGEKEPYLKHIVTLNTCSSIDGIIVEPCKTEEELITKWIEFIMKLDPDIITGYNIFGFDFAYIWDRACELEITDEDNLLDSPIFMGRIKALPSKLEIKKLASSALGDNTLSYITMQGRVHIDLLKVIQRDHNLASYKLDNVGGHFMNDSILDVIHTNDNSSILKVSGIHTISNGSYITIDYNSNSPDKHYKNEKYMVLDVEKVNNYITINKPIKRELLFNESSSKIKWQLAKDDVTPKEIFQFQRENADKRAIIAKYCVQDCTLCLNIINKLDIITNNMGMANVCYVPLSFIFLRGQGIKIFSLVSKECKQEDFLIPLIKHEREEEVVNLEYKEYKFNRWVGNQKFTRFEPEEDDNQIAGDDGYEGAIVLNPQPDIYLETPVTVLDYASLYPSSMISENLSLDSIILPNSIYEGDKGVEELKKIGYSHVDIEYDTFTWKDPKVKTQGKIKSGTKTVRYAQPPNEDKSIIPRILMKLLNARKETRGKIKTVTDPFQKSVLDGLQLAYKLTANSLYGQIGAKTSPIYMKDIAASTTATGRKLLYLAKEKTEEYYKDAKIVYGDTDSIFINFNPKDEQGNPIKNKAALAKSIEMGLEVEKYIQQFLKKPHKLEYEKTFWPFILFSKKRYIGNKYETDIENYTQNSMGIVLKRRDNADIVKHIYGGVIDIIMNQHNLEKSIEFCRNECRKLLDGKFNMDLLVITKSLRGFYKNPQQIAHKVLADRMGIREPGNKPKSNDRIPYAYIEHKELKGAKLLQGDKIEHPDYIKENNINPDYKFYITNQIMKPVGQIYALTVETLSGFKYDSGYYKRKYKEYLNKYDCPVKATNKVRDLKYKDASDIIFGEILRVANNRKNKVREITDFFK